MVVFSSIAGIYLGVGIIALLIFDIITKRVRNRLSATSYEAQSVMWKAGSGAGYKTAMAVTLIYLWLLWLPVIAYGILSSVRKSNEQQG